MNSIFNSTLGRKYVMAVTGLILFGFVVGHLIGNLQIFGPPELINTYGHFLQSKKLALWCIRLFLLVMVVLHIITASQLTAMNRAARPTPYITRPGWGSSWASRYMLVSGIVIAAFVIYHLLHFTALTPSINGVGDFSKLRTSLHGENVPDIYAMMILGFQVWWVSLFYIIAQALLFVHLYHGLASMFQSVGARNDNWWPTVQRITQVAAIAVFIGYILIPIAIYFRVVGSDYAEQKRGELSRAAMVESVAPAGKEAK